MSNTVRTRLIPLLVAVLVGGAAISCSSSSDDTATPDTAIEDAAGDDTSGDDTSDASGSDFALPAGVTMSDVTCTVGTDFTAEDATDVDCTESHDAEEFTLEDSEDLDDCYRALAETTDLVIQLDDEGELDMDDDRVNGHSFGGGGGVYDCQIILTEPRTDPLIQR